MNINQKINLRSLPHGEWSKIKKVLVEYAKQVDACTGSIRALQNLNTAQDMSRFLERYCDFIPSIFDSGVDIEDSNRVIQWLEDPFVSDWDKEKVIDYILKKRQESA